MPTRSLFVLVRSFVHTLSFYFIAFFFNPQCLCISECDFDDCANECLVVRILNARKKIVMWFFKWNIALVGFRLFTSRRRRGRCCYCCCCSFAGNASATLHFFRVLFPFAPTALESNKNSVIYYTFSRLPNEHSLHSMQMITHIHKHIHTATNCASMENVWNQEKPKESHLCLFIDLHR